MPPKALAALQKIVFRPCRIAIEQFYQFFLNVWAYDHVPQQNLFEARNMLLGLGLRLPL